MSDRSEAHGDSHITIPREALEAAAGIVAEYRISARSDAGIAYQVCLAMLKAWPGMDIAHDDDWCAIRKGWITLPQELEA